MLSIGAAILLLGANPTSPLEANAERWLLLVRADADVQWSGAASDEVRSVARHRIGMRLLSSEEVFFAGGAESFLAECGANAECVAARIRGAEVSHALFLVVRQVDRTVVIASRVIDAKTGQVVHQDLAEVAPGEAPVAAVASIARASFDALGHRPGGFLLPKSAPSECRLEVKGPAGDRVAVSGEVLFLPVGAYRVEASLDGFVTRSAEVNLVEGETQTVELALEPSATIASSPWFWVGLGVVATAIGVGVGVAVVGADRCFCAAANPADCGSCP